MTDNAAVTVKAGRSCVGDAFLGHQVAVDGWRGRTGSPGAATSAWICCGLSVAATAVAHWLALSRVGVSGCWVFLATW